MRRVNSPEDIQVFPFAINEGLHSEALVYATSIDEAIRIFRECNTTLVQSARLMADNE